MVVVRGVACLLAEKLWNNAKFSIREPCKVTPVCSPCAKRPKLFAVGYREGVGGREQQIERKTQKEEEEVWAKIQPIWDVLHRQSVPEVTDKSDPIFVECLKVPCKKMSFRRE